MYANYCTLNMLNCIACPQPGVSTAPWIIAIAIIIPLIVLGVLTLLLIKIILIALVSHSIIYTVIFMIHL